VAARAGLPLAQTAAALNALAADTGATLQVSSAGDLLYVFPDAPRAQLAAKSWRLRLAPALAKARETGELAVRVAFGATLIVSLLVVRASAECSFHLSVSDAAVLIAPCCAATGVHGHHGAAVIQQER
jgi:hypothetical protein